VLKNMATFEAANIDTDYLEDIEKIGEGAFQ